MKHKIFAIEVLGWIGSVVAITAIVAAADCTLFLFHHKWHAATWMLGWISGAVYSDLIWPKIAACKAKMKNAIVAKQSLQQANKALNFDWWAFGYGLVLAAVSFALTYGILTLNIK
jgi:hypothetical protein